MPPITAVVMCILDIVEDPADPSGSTIYTVDVLLLFIGPQPMEQQLEVSIPNTATKAQIKTAIDSAIIVAAASLGGALTTARILTVADIAG